MAHTVCVLLRGCEICCKGTLRGEWRQKRKPKGKMRERLDPDNNLQRGAVGGRKDLLNKMFFVAVESVESEGKLFRRRLFVPVSSHYWGLEGGEGGDEKGLFPPGIAVRWFT